MGNLGSKREPRPNLQIGLLVVKTEVLFLEPEWLPTSVV